MSSNFLPRELSTVLRREKYQIVGKHSAVKKCQWLHKSLTGGETCYKNKFYGIKSWRCLQMTPTVANCTMRCLFCWRVQPSDVDLNLEEAGALRDSDEPETIAEECLRAQRRILVGYKSHSQVNWERYFEALKPEHAAISLAGEPTLYQELGDLVHAFRKKGLTTFRVTNGILPRGSRAADGRTLATICLYSCS